MTANALSGRNEHFDRKLAWAVQLGVWSHKSVASAFEMNLSAVYNASAARYEPHRTYAENIRVAPYDYASKHIPVWLFDALDAGNRIGADLHLPPNETADRDYVLNAWRSRIVGRRTGTHKFNDRLRRAVLLELARMRSDGSPVWGVMDITRAFGIERSTADNMRFGTCGLYPEFHGEYRRHRLGHIRGQGFPGCTIDIPLADAFAAKLALGEDILDDHDELAPDYALWMVIVESHEHAINEMVDGCFHRLVFDALQANQTFNERHDEIPAAKRARLSARVI
jgi:hypothetical protein